VAVGEQFDATLVIWGIADEYGFEPRYEVVRNQDLIPDHPELGVTAADLPTFSAYIAQDVPQEFEYLMLFSLGQMAFFSREYEQAIDLFSQATAIDLGERGAQMNLSATHFYLSAAHQTVGDTQNAIDHISAAFAAHSVLSVTAVGLPVPLNPEATIVDLDRTIESDPANAQLYFERGVSYLVLGDPVAARADLDRAIDLAPSFADAYRARAHVNWSASIASPAADHRVVIGDLDRAIELDPGNAHAYLQRGALQFYVGEMGAAIADFNRALTRDPQLTFAYAARGAAHDAVGDTQAALADYRQFLDDYPVDDALSAMIRVRVAELEETG
jgi:tetratricopeptide (TPR) repeat protein